MRTWTITVSKLAEKSSFVLDLLRFMSFLHHDVITIQLVKSIPECKALDEMEMLELLAMLKNFGFLEQLRDPAKYKLHRLVAFWTRQDTDLDQQPRLLQTLTKTFTKLSDSPEGQDHSRRSEILLHSKAILEHWDSNAIPRQKDYILLQSAVASIFQKNGCIDEAYDCYMKAYEGAIKDPVLRDMLESRVKESEYSARMFDLLAKSGKTQAWLEERLAAQGNELGLFHPKTLNTTEELGWVCRMRDSYPEALGWFELVLEGRESYLGRDHIDTLKALYLKAHVLLLLDKRQDSLKTVDGAITTFETLYGKKSPRTTQYIFGMAEVYAELGFF